MAKHGAADLTAARTAGHGARRQGIRSLEVGIRIFQEVHRLRRSVTLTELSTLTRMHPSKVHRYCVSLINTGLLQQNSRGLYGLGPFGFELSHPQAELEHAKTLAMEMLPKLVRDIGETVFIAAWGQTCPANFDVLDAPRPISIRPTMSGDLPLLNTATGRVFAAFLDPARLTLLLEAELGTLMRAGTLPKQEVEATRKSFMRHLGDVRKRGLGRTTGERYAGLASFSAPVFARSGQVILALTSFGVAPSLPTQWDSAVAQALRAGATELTRRIGGREPAAIAAMTSERR
jgi:DNA-binding IclR family transcriptional regulator